MSTVLVVDDAPEVAQHHAELVRQLGHVALIETDPRAVEGRLSTERVDLVLSDLRMPGIDGLELLARVRCRFPHVGVVLATVADEIRVAVEAIRAGAYNYLLKPLTADQLGPALEGALGALDAGSRLRDDPAYAGFITAAPVFEPLFDALERFAAADVPVLIQGETGTGKELIAELIHRLSPRAERPFVALNVAALPPSLFESELFGYRRGAFSGAHADHAGHIEAAGDGTLLFDEIGELGPSQQASLLRVLQDRRFARVGDTVMREARCRFVFSTNRVLAPGDGFRDDLYYRLSPHRVRLPPLREREGDVDLLAGYFLRKYATQYGRALTAFEPAAIDALRRYAFPGNVRELEGMLSAAVLLERGSRVGLASLPEHLSAGQRLAQPPTEDEGSLDALRMREVERVLEECDGNKTRAAERLGIARATLHRWLKRHRDEGGVALNR